MKNLACGPYAEPRPLSLIVSARLLFLIVIPQCLNAESIFAFFSSPFVQTSSLPDGEDRYAAAHSPPSVLDSGIRRNDDVVVRFKPDQGGIAPENVRYLRPMKATRNSLLRHTSPNAARRGSA